MRTLQVTKAEVGDAGESAIRCSKGAMTGRGASGVKYSASTRHRSNTFAILNIVGEQYPRYVRLYDSQKGKRRVFPGGLPMRGSSLSSSPRYLENIPGPSLFLLHLFLAASHFPFSSISRFVSIRLLCASRFFSDY